MLNCYYFVLLIILLDCQPIMRGDTVRGKTEMSYNYQIFNSSDFFSIWDLSNVPEDIVNNFNKIEEILEILATRKYRSCKASVLYHPLKKIYYFRNPSIQRSGTGSMKEYMALKCKSFASRSASLRQRFYIPFKDIEQLLDNNEDSIFLEGIHELTELRNGIEMSLFPVKFYKSMPESNYLEMKDMICYDSIKVIGIDKNNFDYFIISALDKHKILYCDSTDLTRKNNMNNFIRYSSYCDEFCAEDFIYFSNDLIKCKCEFFSYADDLKKNKNYLIKNNGTEGCYYARRLDRYEIFANPYEIAEKITKYEEQNKSYYRYYLHLIIILFTFQLLYAFYFTTKNSLFIKFTIIFYIIMAVIVYVPHRIKLSNLDYVKLFEVISDLYPVLLLVVISCDSNSKQYDILKLSFMIFSNSLDNILKETPVNELELILRFIFIVSSFLIGNTLEYSGNYLNFYNVNVRVKNVFELISRFFLYLSERNKIADISVPLFVILGRPREAHITNDHILFQANYLKLKPNFDKLFENWFMEALNFHKFKNMIIFLKIIRYGLIIVILSIFNLWSEIKKIANYLIEFQFNRIFYLLLELNFKHTTTTYFQNSKIINYLHIPIFLSLLFTNVLFTKDCLKFFVVHFMLGFLLFLLSENKNKRRRNIQNSQANNNLFVNNAEGNNDVNYNINGIHNIN